MALSCAPAAIIGLIKFKGAELKFSPFILILSLSLCTELLIKLIIETESWKLYYLVGNIYYLTNVFLYYEFFRKTTFEQKSNRLCYFSAFVLIFMFNALVKNPIQSLFLYAAVLYSLFILACSVRLLSNQVFETRQPFFKNPLFFIATGCILFNTYFIFTQTAYFTIGNIGWLTNDTFFIEKIINTITYLFFLIAVLCIPRKN